MVNPVTGPFSGSLSTGGSLGKGALYKKWSRYRQKKPYTLPLPYDAAQNSVTSCSVPGGPCWGNAENYASRWRKPSNVSSDWMFCRGNFQDLNNPDPEIQRAIQRAREKFMGEVGERVEGMVNLLQLNQAVEMISKRLMQVHRFTKAVRSGNVIQALNELNIHGHERRVRVHFDARRDLRRGVKDFGSTWLEYSYGLKPILEDIHNGAKILSSDFGLRPIKTRAKESYLRDFSRRDTSLNGGDLVKATLRGTAKATVGGNVMITNPNLFLAQKMGLTNPLEWAWELIPLSFVVDWFVNFGDFLSSLDETVGLSIQDGYYVWTWSVAYDMSYRFPYFGQYSQCIGTVAQTSRKLGIPTFRLVKSRSVISSLPRALNAISLLVQGFKIV